MSIDIRKILAEQASEAETKRAMEILARPERDEEVIVMLADAVEFWGKRCEKLEKQRGELISALNWHKARNPVLKVRGEVEYRDLERQRAEYCG